MSNFGGQCSTIAHTFVEKVGFEPGVKEWQMMRAGMMTEMRWQVDEEVDRDNTGEADEINLEVDCKDEVMHTNDVSHRATAVFSVKCFNQLKVYPLSGTILRKQCASYIMLPRADADDERAAVVGGDLNIHIEDLGDSGGVRLAELLD